MPGHLFRLHAAQRLTRRGEQVSNDERGVAHHVVQHAAALHLSAPEPRHVRTAVFLRRAREVRPTSGGGSSRPGEIASRFDVRSEELVLEVSVLQASVLHQLRDVPGLGDVARQRLLAGNSLQLAFAALNRGDDFLDVFDARVIRPGEPDGVDGCITDHVGDRRVGPGVADVEITRELRGTLGVLAVRAPDAKHLGVAHRPKPLHVKFCVEATADEPDAETSLFHLSIAAREFIRS